MSITKKASKILLILLAAHISISLTFIFFNKFLVKTKASRIYKVYVMPGPFFSEHTITTSTHLLVSWKHHGEWTQPTNTALTQFNKFNSTFNNMYSNKSRFERALCKNVVKQMYAHTKINLLESSQWAHLKNYISKEIAPADSDSLSVSIILKSPSKADSLMFTAKVPKQ